jgi:hypothetical protein
MIRNTTGIKHIDEQQASEAIAAAERKRAIDARILEEQFDYPINYRQPQRR